MNRPTPRALAGLMGLFGTLVPSLALAAGDGGHWSLLSALPFRENLAHMMGRSWVEGVEVHSVDHILFGVIVSVIAIGLALAARARLANAESAIVPDAKLTPLVFFELVLDGVLGQMTKMMGRKKALDTFPIITSLAVVILLGNLIGLVPGLGTPNDNLNSTLAMGLCVFVLTHFYGLKYNGLNYLKHFFGPITKWYALPLMLLLFVIELVSHTVRPISLGLRLMGNMIGDHAVLFIFLGFGILFVPLPVMVLGLLVCVVQTLVFCLLSMVYIAMAVEDMDHHH